MITEKKLTETSPASAQTLAGSNAIGGLDVFDRITLVAELVGATGGTLDVVLQTSYQPSGSKWYDMVHFAQLAAGAAAVSYAVEFKDIVATAAPLTLTTLGTLTVNTRVLGLPLGCRARMLFISGVGTSLGASQNITAFGQRFR